MQYDSLLLTVNIKPGVLSRICALYAQHGYNVEGVLANRNRDGSAMDVWLMINENNGINQLVEELLEIPDILDVRLEKADKNAFAKCVDCLKSDRSKAP